MRPGRLRDIPFKISYGPSDDRLHEFYIPALSVSVRYERSAGFFSSSALAVAAQGVAHLIANGGRMRLLVGAELSEDDVAAIVEGRERLDELLDRRMRGRLEEIAEAIQRDRLAALAWMVAEGTLEVRVVLPRDPSGRLLPATEAEAYYHTKEGVFTDAFGDQVAFTGSANESETAWLRNYEQFSVYRSWDESRPYLRQVVHRLEAVWEGRERDWVSLELPEATRQGLLKFRPASAPRRDPLERKEVRETRLLVDAAAPVGQRERLLAQYLRDAPRLWNAGDLGVATSPVEPWPHQLETVRQIVERYPQSFLIADEVGLGKTVQAALALRALVLQGLVRRCLILVPAGLARQWQEELYEKAALNVPRYDGSRAWDYFHEEVPISASDPFRTSVLLMSSHLARRADRAAQLRAAEPWDLVIVDEAHHARAWRAGRVQANQMMRLLRELRERSRALLFLTATPMQLDARELWDLLVLLGLGGSWGASEEAFVRFFDELAKPLEERDWRLIRETFREFRDAGGRVDERFAEIATAQLGATGWQVVRDVLEGKSDPKMLRAIHPEADHFAVELARRHTPLAVFMRRNTRERLRGYYEQGLLRERIPQRKATPVWIEMTDQERSLYERIEDGTSKLYQRYEERAGKGFAMAVYRRRMTSSLYALEQSLRRRLRALRGEGEWLTEEDREELDIEEEDVAADPLLAGEEEQFIYSLLGEIHSVEKESKVERLYQDLQELFGRYEQVLVFSQYADTAEYLRDHLASVYGGLVASYTGQGGMVWDGGVWQPTTKEEIKRRFAEGRIRLLVCTDAASEGLNLQTCGALINFDMPWNPMRVEQRIGRIDRIGQRHPEVEVIHYFYEGTIEVEVYRRLAHRIQWFQRVVGGLQPILGRVEALIERVGFAPKPERESELQRGIAEIEAEAARLEALAESLDRALQREPVPVDPPRTPVEFRDVERTMRAIANLGWTLERHREFPGVYVLRRAGHGEQLVTFDRGVFEDRPNSVVLLTYGSGLLEELLRSVPAPDEVEEGIVRRCAEADGMQVCGYLGEGGNWVASLSELEAGAATSPAPETAVEDVLRERLRQLREIESWEARSREASLVIRAAEALRKAAALRKARAVPYDRVVTVTPADVDALVNDPAHSVPYRGLWVKVVSWGRQADVVGDVLVGNVESSVLDGQFGAAKQEAMRLAKQIASLERAPQALGHEPRVTVNVYARPEVGGS